MVKYTCILTPYLQHQENKALYRYIKKTLSKMKWHENVESRYLVALLSLWLQVHTLRDILC